MSEAIVRINKLLEQLDSDSQRQTTELMTEIVTCLSRMSEAINNPRVIKKTIDLNINLTIQAAGNPSD